jgi:hypothetical protein
MSSTTSDSHYPSISFRNWLKQRQAEFSNIANILGVAISSEHNNAAGAGAHHDEIVEWCPLCRTVLSNKPQNKLKHIENCILRNIFNVTNPHEVVCVLLSLSLSLSLSH